MCNILYSNSSKNATARSMNLEDVKDKMDLSSYDYHDYSNNGIKYGETRSYSSNIKYYPVQWKNDNGVQGESESRSLIPSTGTIVEETNADLTVTQTFWTGCTFKVAQTSLNENDASIYYKLLMTAEPSYGTYYNKWLASRSVNIYDSECRFMLSMVWNGNVANSEMMSFAYGDQYDRCWYWYTSNSFSSIYSNKYKNR